MNLTPEERQAGKDSFAEAIGGDPNRREFLKGTLAATVAGAGLGAMYFGYQQGGAPKNPLRVGYIGVGDEGEVLLGALKSPETQKYLQVVAIADIRPYSVHRAFWGDWSSDDALQRRPGLMSIYGWKTEEEARRNVKVYDKDYMDLLNDDDVEAVVIALPLHLHAEVAIKAMRKGKHVLTEKLMGHTVHECKEMGRVAEDENKILAVGHQRNYSILYDNAKWLIRNGLLGDVHHIRAQWHRDNLPGHDSWQMPIPSNAADKAKLEKEIAALEKELKDGSPSSHDKVTRKLAQWRKQLEDAGVDAAAAGYQPIHIGDETRPPLEELIRWRLWNRTGAGLMAELGSHQLDAAGILIGAVHERATNSKETMHALPLNVTAIGGRSLFPADRDCEDHVYCMFEFPAPGYEKDSNKKIVVTYSSINGNGFGGWGEIVMGTKGTLVLERELDALLIGKAAPTKVSTDKKGAGPVLNTAESGGHGPAIAKAALDLGPISRGYTEELEHWAWCIKNSTPGKKPEHLPRCHPEVALGDAVIALTTNAVIREGKDPRREFQKEWFKIDSDETPEGEKPNTKRDNYRV